MTSRKCAECAKWLIFGKCTSKTCARCSEASLLPDSKTCARSSESCPLLEVKAVKQQEEVRLAERPKSCTSLSPSLEDFPPMVTSLSATNVAPLMTLRKECHQRIGEFLDYQSFCAARLGGGVLLREGLRFGGCFRDWVGAIDTTLVCKVKSGPDIKNWIQHEDSKFEVNLNDNLTPESVCDAFTPHTFRPTMCLHCKTAVENHHQLRRRGGKLVLGSRKTGRVSGLTERGLYFNLRTTMDLVGHIDERAQEEIRREFEGGYGRIDSVTLYLYGPLCIEDQQVAPTNVEKEVHFSCGSHRDSFSVGPFPLETIRRFDNSYSRD
jgi:hypothetical protein